MIYRRDMNIPKRSFDFTKVVLDFVLIQGLEFFLRISRSDDTNFNILLRKFALKGVLKRENGGVNSILNVKVI